MKIVNGEKRGRPGRWLLDFVDQDGKRRWETYYSKADAKAALSKRLEQVGKRTYRAPAQIPTLREVAESWLVRKSDRRPSTVGAWEGQIANHIVPCLGDVRIDQISPQMIESQLRNVLLGEKKLAPVMVNKVLGTLTSIFDHAARDGHVERNAARLAERARRTEATGGDESVADDGKVSPDDVPSPEDVKRFLIATEPGVFRAFFTTAALTGARCGELLALNWEDIDFEASQIHIRRGVTWARTRAEKAAGVKGARYYAPKNKTSRRSVEMPVELASVLKRWKLACPPSRDSLVFPRRDGSAMRRQTLYVGGLAPALARAGVRRFRVHALRHFFASELIRRGYPPTEVAARLGHASPMITMTVLRSVVSRSEERCRIDPC